MNILYVWDALGIHTMVVCKAAMLFGEVCQGKRCPSETSCRRAKLYVCMFLIVGVQRQSPGARDRTCVCVSFLLSSKWSCYYCQGLQHFCSQHPRFLQPSPALLDFVFFSSSSATLLHVQVGSCILILYTIALSADARRFQAVKCFSYFSWGDDMALLLGNISFCWYSKKCWVM